MSEFKRILTEMAEVHEAKDTDYAGGIEFGNFSESEKIGVPAWKGAFIRLQDKYSRCVQLIAKNEHHEVKDESLNDTLLDLANYSVIVLCLRNQEKNRTKGDN